MTQYLLSVWHAEDDEVYPDEATMQRAFTQVGIFNEELQASGSWLFAGGLQPPSSASVVRVTDSGTSVTDGPLAEANKHIGGFWLIETADLALMHTGLQLDHVAVLGAAQGFRQALPRRHAQRGCSGCAGAQPAHPPHHQRCPGAPGGTQGHCSSAQVQPSRATSALAAAGPQPPAA